MHTNNTPHYNLPQFIGSDIPNPLTDWNDSMQAIDNAMYEIKTQADEIGSDIVDDEADIDDLQSQANLTDDNITLLNQQTTAARTAATDAQDAANRNTANITTLQQSVTNNRTSITQYNNRFNQNVPFAFGIEEVEDPDNPGTMIEKYGYYTNDDPAEFVAFGEAPVALRNGLLLMSPIKGDNPAGAMSAMANCVLYNTDYATASGNTITMLKNATLKSLCSLIRTSGSAVSITITKNNNTIYSKTDIQMYNEAGGYYHIDEHEFTVEAGDVITADITIASNSDGYGQFAIIIE